MASASHSLVYGKKTDNAHQRKNDLVFPHSLYEFSLWFFECFQRKMFLVWHFGKVNMSIKGETIISNSLMAYKKQTMIVIWHIFKIVEESAAFLQLKPMLWGCAGWKIKQLWLNSSKVENQKSGSCECCMVKSKIKQLWVLYGEIKNQAAVSVVW